VAIHGILKQIMYDVGAYPDMNTSEYIVADLPKVIEPCPRKS